MTCTIVLIGGPADGRYYAIPDNAPPYAWHVAIPPDFRALFADPTAVTTLERAEYQPILEQGLFSYDETGAYRYRYARTIPGPHPGQTRPAPTLDELAEMPTDPPPSAYPDRRAHQLAVRTRHALRRDARPNDAEQQTLVDEGLPLLIAAANRRRSDV